MHHCPAVLAIMDLNIGEIMDLSCTYLAHHDLDSIIIMIMIIIVITIVVIIYIIIIIVVSIGTPYNTLQHIIQDGERLLQSWSGLTLNLV